MGGYFFRCRRCRAVLLGAVLAQGAASAAYAADALPAGGHFVAGTGSIAGDGNALAISQSGNTGIIDWNSFSIGSGHSVTIDNGSGATLNRVTGSDLSRIDGLLSATGSAYLINRNGIVVGPGGRVVTGGSFVGSTRDISNEDFLNGGADRFSGASAGDVVNQGTIRAEGGDAVLIGRNVTNSGSIDAPEGTAAMAAGNDVVLQPVGGDRRIYIQGSAGEGDVTNEGAVTAAQAELAAANGNVYALAGNTDGVIRATGSAMKDGRVLLTAGGDVSVSGKLAATDADGSGGAVSVRGANIDMSGGIDASAAKPGRNGGDVSIIAMGTTGFSGTIKAEGGAGAKGGEVETSGEHLNVAESARVSTLAEAGQSGTWLLDPNDFTIAASGGDITGATLSTNLAGGNVAISSNDGATSGNGDIFVNDAVTWSANTTLTLNAVRNIEINNGIAASGAGAGLVLTYGGNYSFANGGTVTLSGASASLSMGGNAYTLIHNANDLQAINGSGYYALADNVDASGTASWNSGAGFNTIGGFSGILAGLNHAIDGLTINRAGETSVGMFSSTTGRFRDFTLSNVSIVSGGSVGALAYRIEGGSGVSNIHVTGNVTSVGGGGQVGGLIGWLDQTPLSDSSSTATVTGFGEVGGLVGRLRAASITDSYATGAVTGTTDYVGGLVGGTYQGGTLTDVYASGNVTGTTNVGGLVGGAVFAGAVTANNAYWDVDSTGQSTSFAGTGIDNADAFTAATYSGFDFTDTWVLIDGQTRPMLQSEYATTIFTPHQLQLMALDLGADYTLGTDIDMTGAFTANGGGYYGGVWSSAGFDPVGIYSASPFTGGLDGQGHTIKGLTIDRSGEDNVGLFTITQNAIVKDLTLSGGSITGGQGVGALAGQFNAGSITSVSSGVSVEGSNFVGGLVGANQQLTAISLSSAGGDVTGTGYAVGGLIGALFEGTLDQSYATGNVSGANLVGGLVGANGFASPGGVIDQSFATGKVTGSVSQIGGLAGYSSKIITNSYATGNVTGTGSASKVGGLVGELETAATIDSAYSTGLVSGASDVGGFVGLSDDGASAITSSYWNTETSGQASGLGDTSGGDVTGLTTAELQGTLPAGFSNTVWATGTNLYPYFSWLYPGGAKAVSGIAYSDAGATALVGANVSAISGGSLLGSAGTGANGYYYILAAPGSIDTSGALAYLDGESTQAAAFSDDVAATGVTNLDIYGTALNLIASGSTLGGTLTNLNTTLASYSDTDVDFFNPASTKVTYDGYDLYLHADQAYAIDGNLTSGGALSLGGSGTYSVTGDRTLKADGDLTIASAFAWSDASALTLETINAGDIQLDAGITASSGSLTLNGSGSVATGASTAVDLALFDLASGAWSQIGASLPSFSAGDFRLDPANATFLRALGGDGSTGTPYRIADIYGLQGIGSASLLAKDFVLANDVDASGTSGWNSGAGFDPIGTFGGVFNGQGHAITGMTINRGSTNNVGLFGVLSGTVSDIGLIGGSFTGLGESGTLVGIVNASGSVTRAYSTAAIMAGGNFAGGLVGQNFGTVSLSYAGGTVTSSASSAGGLVGVNDGTISDSYATGAVSAANYAGGFAGGNRVTLERVYSTGLVSGGGSNGGLTPYNSGTITAGYWNTETSGTSSGYGTGVTTAQLQSLSTFAGAGWDIDDAGGTAKVWRIYDGNTAPLLRTFMTGLTVTGGSGTKTYDGTDTSTDVGTLSYSPSSHDGSLVLGTATYTTSSADAGTYSGSDVSLGGLYSTQFGYDMTLVAGTMTVNKAALTVTAANDSKTYDGNAYSGGNGVSYSGFVNSETASVLSGSLGYGGTSQGAVNAGSYTITASGLTSGNYDISYVAGTLTVGKASLTVTASAASKTYGDALSLTGFSSSGLVGSDSISSVTLTSTGAAAGANVGSYDISSSNAVFGTGSAANYDIQYNTLTDGLTVNKAALTVTANNDSKTFDGNAYSGGNGVSYSGFVNSETASVLSGSLSYGGTSQGAVNAGTYAITVSGLTSGNYDISYVAGTLTVGAATVNLTITPDAASKTYGDTLSLTGFSTTGLIGSDSISSVTLTSPGTAATANVGSYDISSSNAVFGTGSASNYDIHYNTLTDGLTITARPITVTADNLARVYGASNPAFTWQVTSGSLVNGDTPSGALATSATASSNVGAYGLAQGTFGLGANYALTFLPGTLTVDPATLTITADDREKNTGQSIVLSGYRVNGLVSGDTVTGVTLASTGTDANAAVGSYAIVASNATGSGLSNYDIHYGDGTLTVRDTVPGQSLRTIEPHPFVPSWQLADGEVGPGEGAGGFWSMPLLLQPSALVYDERSGRWIVLDGRAGRLNRTRHISYRLRPASEQALRTGERE